MISIRSFDVGQIQSYLGHSKFEVFLGDMLSPFTQSIHTYHTKSAQGKKRVQAMLTSFCANTSDLST